jgi:CRP/FNR family transcriptional regulator, cyclic AMP receptor protein
MTDRVDAARLADVELFSELTDEDREQVAQMMRLTRAPVGTVVAVEGDLPTKFFVLLTGTVTVHRAGRHLADLGAGEVFGEAGAVVLQARNASVIATTPAELGVLMGWDLRGLIARYPSVKERIDALVDARSEG